MTELKVRLVDSLVIFISALTFIGLLGYTGNVVEFAKQANSIVDCACIVTMIFLAVSFIAYQIWCVMYAIKKTKEKPMYVICILGIFYMIAHGIV